MLQGLTREIPVLLQGFTREKIDIISGLGCEKPCESLYYLGGGVPYLNTLSRTIPYLNTLSRTIPYLNIINRFLPYLNTLIRIIPYLKTLRRTIPYLNILNRTIPYLNRLIRTIPYLNTLQPAANQVRVFLHPSRQPIRIEYYVTRELSARVEVPSRLSARVGSLEPILMHRDLNPPPPDLLTHILLIIEFVCLNLQ